MNKRWVTYLDIVVGPIISGGLAIRPQRTKERGEGSIRKLRRLKGGSSSGEMRRWGFFVVALVTSGGRQTKGPPAGAK